MATIRRPQSPSRRYSHLHPFSTSTPLPSSPLRHSSSSSVNSPRHPPPPHPHPPLLRRPLIYLFFFFVLGFVLGLVAFLAAVSPAASIPSPGSEPRLIAQQSGERKEEHGKLLIVVTATAAGPMQAARLHRLSQTLRLVPPPLLWLVAEQGAVAGGNVVASDDVAELLRRSGVVYRHIVCCGNASAPAVDEGARKRLRLEQRNEALELLERHRLDGVVYFADDENIYSLDLFQHLRQVRRFGTWPVTSLTQSTEDVILGGPVCRQSTVTGWHTPENDKWTRRFHAAMSGFAFNSTMLWDPILRVQQAWNAIRFVKNANEGLEVTTFIEQLVEDESQMEGIPPDCSKIMNWQPELDPELSLYPIGWKVSSNLDVVIPLK